MSFRTPRRKADTGLLLSVILLAGAWALSAWVLMLVVGNLHHAGFPFPAIGFWTTFWAMTPLYVGSTIVGVIKGMSGR